MYPRSIVNLCVVAMATFLLGPFVFDYTVRQIFPFAEIEFFDVIKIDGYKEQISDFEYNKYNSILFVSLIYPYIVFVLFIVVFFTFAYFGKKHEILFRFEKKYLGGFLFIFLISIVYYLGDLAKPRFSRKKIEYHEYMSIKEYVDWQIDVYLFAIGLFFILAFVGVTSMFKFTVTEQPSQTNSRQNGRSLPSK